MIIAVIDLLRATNHYGGYKHIEIAKGKNALNSDLKTAYKKLQRGIKNARKNHKA